MRYRTLGISGLEVSQVSLGTMTFGRESNKSEAAAMYQLAREHGVNLFDTANAYAGGQSEEILGQLIAGHRHEVIIASKAASHLEPSIHQKGANRVHLTHALEQSLRRLNTDYIDLYYIHFLDPRTDWEITLRWLDDAISSGKIRYAGLSNYSAWQVATNLGLCDLHHWQKPIAIQPMYSLLKRQVEVELLPMALHHNLGVVCYSPLAAGVLSGKYTSKHRSSEPARLCSDTKYQNRYGDTWFYDVGQSFAQLASEAGWHPVTLANAWALKHPAVSSVLAGARHAQQLEAALAAGESEPSDDLYKACNALVPPPPIATDRNEERA